MLVHDIHPGSMYQSRISLALIECCDVSESVGSPRRTRGHELRRRREKVEAIAQQIGTRPEAPGRYDILVLDASYKQSLACVRSLGRAGLKVAAGESAAESDPAHPAL